MMSIYRYFIGIIFYFLLFPNAKSQFVYHDQGVPVSIDSLDRLLISAQQIYDSLRAKRIEVSRADIVEISEKPYMLLDGTFDVYEWEGGKWENKYNNVFFGYNFKSTKFVYNNRIFSLGGYGFWRSHGELIEFIRSRGEWEIISNTVKMPYVKGYVYDDKLYMYAQDSIYTLDLKNKFRFISSKSSKLPIPEMSLKSNFYDFENYGLVYATGSDYIIEKRTGHLYKSDLNSFYKLPKSIVNGISIVRGDSILCYDRHLNEIEFYDVKEEMKFFELQQVKEANSNLSIILLVVLICITAVIGWIFWQYRSRMQNQIPETSDEALSNIYEVNPLFRKMEAYAGQQLSQETLDEIFEIKEIPSFETQRYKRALMIKELNEVYQQYYNIDIILRKKNIKDKRSFVYVINPAPKVEIEQSIR